MLLRLAQCTIGPFDIAYAFARLDLGRDTARLDLGPGLVGEIMVLVMLIIMMGPMRLAERRD